MIILPLTELLEEEAAAVTQKFLEEEAAAVTQDRTVRVFRMPK